MDHRVAIEPRSTNGYRKCRNPQYLSDRGAFASILSVEFYYWPIKLLMFKFHSVKPRFAFPLNNRAYVARSNCQQEPFLARARCTFSYPDMSLEKTGLGVIQKSQYNNYSMEFAPNENSISLERPAFQR